MSGRGKRSSWENTGFPYGHEAGINMGVIKEGVRGKGKYEGSERKVVWNTKFSLAKPAFRA